MSPLSVEDWMNFENFTNEERSWNMMMHKVAAFHSKFDFENWKKSEAFRKAHSGGGQHQGIYLGHPEFEGFEVIL